MTWCIFKQRSVAVNKVAGKISAVGAVCLVLVLSACSDKPKDSEQGHSKVETAQTEMANAKSSQAAAVQPAREDATANMNAEPPFTKFEAHGNEPFWFIQVNGDTMIYSTPDMPKGKQLSAKRLAYAKGIEYSGELDGVTYTLNINGTECFDDMSGEPFEMTAIFHFGEQTLKGCAERI